MKVYGVDIPDGDLMTNKLSFDRLGSKTIFVVYSCGTPFTRWYHNTSTDVRGH